MKENQKVFVSYPDGEESHFTTVTELREKWNQETETWQKAFFAQLETARVAYSRFGKYELLNNTPNL